MKPRAASGRTVEEWQLLGQRQRVDGWLPVVTRTYRMPDGSISNWDIHQTPFSTVGVLALTVENEVILARQFRPGPSAILLELPGGIVDEGESLGAAAARELVEETGFEAGSVELAGSCWAFGASTWRRHVAVARDCRLAADVTSWGGDEYCEAVVLPLADYRALLRSGDTTDVDLGYLGLDFASLL